MLAVLLPIGGKTTGELSDLYPNLFVPVGFTFAIWSVIFLLLILFVVYFWINKDSDTYLKSIGLLFIVNALSNGLWLVFWHYEYVFICIFLMLVLLGSLIAMHRKLEISYFKKDSLPWLVSVPISVYLGWISVATIANVTVLFVSSGITNLGLGADTWAAIVLMVAVALALRMLYKYKDVFFALVVCWASFGIYSKRVGDVILEDARIEHTSYISMYILIVAILLTVVQSFIRKTKTSK